MNPPQLFHLRMNEDDQNDGPGSVFSMPSVMEMLLMQPLLISPSWFSASLLFFLNLGWILSNHPLPKFPSDLSIQHTSMCCLEGFTGDDDSFSSSFLNHRISLIISPNLLITLSFQTASLSLLILFSSSLIITHQKRKGIPSDTYSERNDHQLYFNRLHFHPHLQGLWDDDDADSICLSLEMMIIICSRINLRRGGSDFFSSSSSDGYRHETIALIRIALIPFCRISLSVSRILLLLFLIFLLAPFIPMLMRMMMTILLVIIIVITTHGIFIAI